MSQHTQETITQIVVELIAASSGLSVDDVDVHANFETLDLDSLDMVEIAMEIEDAFSTEVSDEDVQSFKTPNDVVNYLVPLLV